MRLDDKILDYLYGKKFSNSLSIQYSYYGPIPNRVSFIRDIVKDKQVIHLGCLDHLPLIDSKIARHQWLHKEITESASSCIGIDIDKEVHEYVKTKYGFDNILLGDFTKIKFPEIISQQWDYAVLGELLEHIDNPVAYLSDIRNNYTDCIKKIIISVPNAWTQASLKNARKSKEVINSDHRYWFTPYTLAKVILRAGMKLDEIYFTNRVPLSYLELAQNKVASLFNKTPNYNFTYASSIVGVAYL